MKPGRHNLILTTVVAFILIGCQQVGPQDQTRTYTGTNGVTMTFEDNSPPRSVYDNQAVPVSLRLHNQGTTSINESTGLLHAELNTQNLYYLTSAGTIQPSTTVELDGKSNVRPRGEEQSVVFGQFQTANRSAIGEVQSAEETVQARICYPYQTDFSTTLCVENPYDARRNNPLCTAQDASSYGGSGAPVAISHIENRMVPVGQASQVIDRQGLSFYDDRIIGTRDVQEETERVVQQPVIQLTVRNIGDGRPALNDGELCATETRTTNQVRVDASLGNASLTCKPQPVRLGPDGVGTTRCRDEDQRLTINSNYQSIFSAELNYNYITTTTKDINIRQRQGFNR